MKFKNRTDRRKYGKRSRGHDHGEVSARWKKHSRITRSIAISSKQILTSKNANSQDRKRFLPGLRRPKLNLALTTKDGELPGTFWFRTRVGASVVVVVVVGTTLEKTAGDCTEEGGFLLRSLRGHNRER